MGRNNGIMTQGQMRRAERVASRQQNNNNYQVVNYTPVCCNQDAYQPSKTSIRNFSQADLDSKKMTIDGKSISFAEYAKESGAQFFMDGEGRTIIVGKLGSKHVLDPKKNEWVSVNNFYGDKALEVNGNINQAQKASFVEKYGLVMKSDGSYQVGDGKKDLRTFSFDMSGDGLKVKLSEGLAMVDGKFVDCKPQIFEKGEWRIDETSGSVLREDLTKEIEMRGLFDLALFNGLTALAENVKAGDKKLANKLAALGKKVEAGHTTLAKGLADLATDVKAGDEKLASDLLALAKKVEAGDEKLTKALNDGLAGLATIVKAGDEKLGSRIIAEVKARTDADAKLTGDIGAEVKARTDADTKLAGDLSTEMKARTDADTKLAGDLSTEVKARTDADTKLAGDLSTEVKARTDADAKLAGDLSTEVKARTDADTRLGTDVNRIANAVSKATEDLTANSDADAERQCQQEAKIYELEQKIAELTKMHEKALLLLELQQASPSQLQQPPAKK